MINVAIIGAGEIVKTFHLPAWKKIKGIKIVGIVDKKVNKAKLLAKNYKIPKAYHNIDSLFKNEKVDAVDVCTPNKQHEKDILFSLKNNKHVICEKPFVLNFKVFKKINYLAQKKKLVCVCAQHQRFRQSSINSKKLVDKNKLGSIYTAHITAIFRRSNTVKNPYFTNISTAGGGPLIDLGSHFIDLAWWIMGNPKPISVFTYTSNKLAKYLKANEKTPWKKFNVEDYAFGGIRFEKKKSITFQIIYLLNANRDKKKIEFFGTKGGLLWPDVKLTTIRNNIVNSKSLNSKEKTSASVLEIQHFIDSIKKNVNQKPSLKETGFMVKILEALSKSVYKNTEIPL